MLNTPSENFVSYGASQSESPTPVEVYQVQTGRSESIRLSSQEVAVASVGLLLLFTIWYFVRQSLRARKASEEGLQTPTGRRGQADRLATTLPCVKCFYFKANMYLPCAVNPTLALKPEAKDCGDFRPRSNSESTTTTR